MACQVDFKPIPHFFVESIPVTNLTVGHVFYLNCQGEFGLKPNFEHAQFSLKEDEKNMIKLLRVEQRSPKNIDLQVVSYTPGEHKISDLQLEVDGELFALGPVDFMIDSVIQMKFPKGQKVEPIGPLGPLHVPFPPWFLTGIFGTIVLVFILSLLKIFTRYQRRKYLDKTSFQKNIPPLLEFEKNLRLAMRLENKGDVVSAVQKVNDTWRIYWTRMFNFPATYFSEKRLLREFRRKQKKLHHKMSREVEQFVWDMRRIRKNANLVTASDFEAYLKRCRLVIEKIDREMEILKGRAE